MFGVKYIWVLWGRCVDFVRKEEETLEHILNECPCLTEYRQRNYARDCWCLPRELWGAPTLQ